MKSATEIDDQIKLLKSRGVIFDNEEKAKEILLDIGYYRLGFYLFPFEETYPSLKNRSHKYKSGTKFENAVALYYFDFDLRCILLRYISRIEVAFRTYLTYYMSNKYKDSITWFVDTKIVDTKFTKNFYEKVYKNLSANVDSIKRHHKKYINDKFAPAWKTIEFMSFGSVIKLYKAIKDIRDKINVAKHFGIGSVTTFENYISTIKTIRNRCAHGNVLFDYKISQSIKSGPIKIKQNSEYALSTAIDVILFILQNISNNRANDLSNSIYEILKMTNMKYPNIKDITQKVVNF